jgi:hypothetical protein
VHGKKLPLRGGESDLNVRPTAQEAVAPVRGGEVRFTVVGFVGGDVNTGARWESSLRREALACGEV